MTRTLLALALLAASFGFAHGADCNDACREVAREMAVEMVNARIEAAREKFAQDLGEIGRKALEAGNEAARKAR